MASARKEQEQEPIPASEWCKEVVIGNPVSSVQLIDKQQRIEVEVGKCGVFEIKCLRKGGKVIGVWASVGDVIEWRLRKEEAVVKLDGSHYFFPVPEGGNDEDLLNRGYMIIGKGSDELDRVLMEYSAFSVEGCGFPDEAKAAASWTALAPNVDDYRGSFARMIASGSGQLIGGILCCGDVTVVTLERGNVFLNNIMTSEKAHVSPEALRRMERVKSLTKMSENVSTGIHSRVPWTGFLTTSIANSKPGKKLFSLLPGEEVVLASLDALDNTCQAVQVAGRKVTSCLRHQLVFE